MEKKIISQGPKGRESYTITLPKEWVLENKLDKTKSINLEVVASKIILGAQMSSEEVKIKIEEFGESIQRIIPLLYREGYSKIEFNVSEEKTIESIYKIIQEQLIGFEITEHKKDKIVIEYITNELEGAFKSTLRRIFLLIEEMFESTSKVKIKHLEKNTQRLINYSQRILLKRGYEDYKELPNYYLLLDRLDKITDELSELLILKLDKKEKDFLDEGKKLFIIGKELFYKFDKQKFNKNSKKSYELFKKTSKERVTPHTYTIVRTISSLYATIFSLKFDKN